MASATGEVIHGCLHTYHCAEAKCKKTFYEITGSLAFGEGRTVQIKGKPLSKFSLPTETQIWEMFYKGGVIVNRTVLDAKNLAEENHLKTVSHQKIQGAVEKALKPA